MLNKLVEALKSNETIIEYNELSKELMNDENFKKNIEEIKQLQRNIKLKKNNEKTLYENKLKLLLSDVNIDIYLNLKKEINYLIEDITKTIEEELQR